MYIGVISDIHGNEAALEATLDALAADGVEEIVCLGDIVGVLGGSDACVTLVRTNCEHVVCGNHDTRFFPDRNWLPARDVDVVEYEHVMEDLTNENYEWLVSLPTIKTAYDAVTLVHSQPDVDDKVGASHGNSGIHPRDAVGVAGKYLDGGTLFIGHTHKAHAVDLDKFDDQTGLVVNPGSVGFPFSTNSGQDATIEDSSRELTGVASYATVETESQEYELHTVEYNHTPTDSMLEFKQ